MSRGVVVKELTAPVTESEIVRSFVAATDVSETIGGHVVIENEGAFGRLFSRVAPFLPIVVLLLLIALVAGYTGSRSPVFWTSFNLANLWY